MLPNGCSHSDFFKYHPKDLTKTMDPPVVSRFTVKTKVYKLTLQTLALGHALLSKTSYHPASAQLTFSKTSIMTQLVGNQICSSFIKKTFPLKYLLKCHLIREASRLPRIKQQPSGPLHSPLTQCYLILSTTFIITWYIYVFIICLLYQVLVYPNTQIYSFTQTFVE